MDDKISLAAKLAAFEGHWQPRTVATMNGHDVMVVKVRGEFPRHVHPDCDDFFLVLKGDLEIRMDDRTIVLRAGDLYVVPRGVAHAPSAREEAHLLLIEPTDTPNTGDPRTAAPRRLA